jgi:hypothetical protein
MEMIRQGLNALNQKTQEPLEFYLSVPKTRIS